MPRTIAAKRNKKLINYYYVPLCMNKDKECSANNLKTNVYTYKLAIIHISIYTDEIKSAIYD